MLRVSGILLEVRTFAGKDGMPGMSIGNLEGLTLSIRDDQVATATGLRGQAVEVEGIIEQNAKWGARIIPVSIMPGRVAKVAG